MQVILLERVEKLGQMGEVVSVKNGFGRNYLVPQGKALRATKANLAEFETRKTQLEATNLERRDEAQAMAGKVEGRMVVVIRQAGEGGQLYGSVNGRDITQAMESDGLTVDRRQVRLDQPIKALGVHKVRIALHPEVDVHVLVNVARSADEAEIQANPALQAAAAEAAANEAAERREEFAGRAEFDDEAEEL